MSELTLANSLEVHESCLFEVSWRLRMNYGNARQFSQDNNIGYLSVFWFLKGNPVVDGDFKAICNVLDFDWEAIQHDAFNLTPDAAIVLRGGNFHPHT